MPIPDERLPEFDESDEVESAADREMLDAEDELEFESAEADTADDAMLDQEEADAGFGFGDPAD
jgi:hypothetical protein